MISERNLIDPLLYFHPLYCWNKNPVNGIQVENNVSRKTFPLYKYLTKKTQICQTSTATNYITDKSQMSASIYCKVNHKDGPKIIPLIPACAGIPNICYLVVALMCVCVKLYFP